MIETFIFDIGNVLLRFDYGIALQKIERNCEVALEKVAPVLDPLKAAFEAGQIGRKEFQEKVKAVIRYAGTDSDLVSAWEDIFTENRSMTRFVEQIHGRYPLYLLSNINDIHVDYIFRKYPIFRLFTDAVFSCRVKCVKPGRQIFEMAINQFQVRPERSAYIDDLEANVTAARTAGFRAIRYNPDDHPAFEQAIEELDLPKIISS